MSQWKNNQDKEIWRLTKIHVPEKESLYFWIWKSSSQRCYCVNAYVYAHVRVEIWVLTKINLPAKESLYFCIWTSFLSAMLLCTRACLCTYARTNLSAYQNSCSWKRKLVLLHMYKFPLSDVTVYTLCLCTFAHRNPWQLACEYELLQLTSPGDRSWTAKTWSS